MTIQKHLFLTVMRGEMSRMNFKLFINLFCINYILTQINALPVQNEEQAAMRSGVAKITSEEKKQGDVNINIRFETGPGSVFAHFSSPQFGGNASFDEQKTRTYDKNKTVNSGINQNEALTPDLGHSLGLSNSEENQEKNECILKKKTPISLVYQPTFVLQLNDIRSISDLHGTRYQIREEPARPSPDVPNLVRNSPTDAVTSTQNGGTTVIKGPGDQIPKAPAIPSSHVPDLCRNPSIDAITRIQNGETYVFKGDFYWKITESLGLAAGYPRRISDDWGGLEGNLDAAVTWRGKTFFFKGGRYWNFTNKNMGSGYPKPISERFRSVPHNLDSACVWSTSEIIYYFKGDRYGTLYPDIANSNSPMTEWIYVAGNTDAALTRGGYTYFFKGDHYYRYASAKHENGQAYPLPTAQYWFGCNAEGPKGQIP